MPSRRRGGLTLLLALAVAAGCGDDEGEEPANVAVHERVTALDPVLAAHLPPGATMETAETGRKLFITCAVCHGLDARGTQLGPSLRTGRWIDLSSGSLEEIEGLIRAGVPDPKEFATPMPVLGGGAFDDEQVRAIATYVYAISHAAAADAPAADTAGADGAP
jgi:mono/diheme cytochrome c family protein